MGQFETANTINVLAGARNPVFLPATSLQPAEQTAQPASGSTYPGTSSGVAFADSNGGVLRASMLAVCREDPAFRTIRINVANFDAAATYSFISSATVTTGPHPDLPTLLTQWAAAIVAAFPGSASAAAIDTDGDGIVDELLIQGLTPSDYRADWSTTSGTSTISGRGDAVSYKMTLYCQSANQARSAPSQWIALNNAIGLSVTVDGMQELVEVSGLSRMYARVFNVAGFAGDNAGLNYQTPVYIAPCRTE